MEKVYLIQDEKNRKYWYGHYTSKKWTNDMSDAKYFYNEDDVFEFIENNYDEVKDLFLVVIMAYVPKHTN